MWKSFRSRLSANSSEWIWQNVESTSNRFSLFFLLRFSKRLKRKIEQIDSRKCNFKAGSLSRTVDRVSKKLSMINRQKRKYSEKFSTEIPETLERSWKILMWKLFHNWTENESKWLIIISSRLIKMCLRKIYERLISSFWKVTASLSSSDNSS